MAGFKNCIKPLGLDLEKKVVIDGGEFVLRRFTPFERQKLNMILKADIKQSEDGNVIIESSKVNKTEFKFEAVATCLGCDRKLSSEGWSFDEKLDRKNLKELIEYNSIVLDVLYSEIDKMEKEYAEYRNDYLGNLKTLSA